MTNLPGQPHQNPFGLDFSSGRPQHHVTGSGYGSGQPQTPHEVRVGPQTDQPLPASPDQPSRHHNDNISWTIGAFLVADEDPWRRERWRRLGEKPEPTGD